MSPVDTEDLAAPEVNADPYGYFGRLRETDPVHWDRLFNSWIVARHSDVAWVIRNQELSSSVTAIDPGEIYPPIDQGDRELAKALNRTLFRSLIFIDRPEHLAMRQAIHLWFTPKAVEKWRAALNVKVEQLIDHHWMDGGMEVKADLATPLPLATICWMLDAPSVDASRLRDLTEWSKGSTHDLVPVLWSWFVRIGFQERGSGVPRSYAPEFRRRVVELVRGGRPVSVVAAEIGVSEATVYRWQAQDGVDRGDQPVT